MLSVDAVKDIAKKMFGIDPIGVTEGTGLVRPITPEMRFQDIIAVRDDRKSRIIDCIKMITTDPRLGRIIYKLAADASVGGFNVTVTDALNDASKKGAQDSIDGCMSRCNLQDNTRSSIMQFLREGDLFYENIVDDKLRQVVRIKSLAAVITGSNLDETGNFPKDILPYYQTHPWTNEPIKTFAPWQIIHVGWMKDPDKPYGIPMFSPARMAYQQLIKGEQNLVIRRATRAGYRLHHKIGDPARPDDWEAVNTYIKKNVDTAKNAMNPIQDYYTTAHAEITELSGDSAIGEMADLQHFEGNVILISGVPMALLGGGREKSVNRDVLEEMQEDYYKVIGDINNLMESAYKRLFDFQLLLDGINIESVTYAFDWSARDREDVDMKIARAVKLLTIGFSFETVFMICNITGVTFEEEMERIESQVAAGIVPYGLGARMDPTMAMIMAQGMFSPEKQTDRNNEVIQELRALRLVGENELTPRVMPLKLQQYAKGG